MYTNKLEKKNFFSVDKILVLVCVDKVIYLINVSFSILGSHVPQEVTENNIHWNKNMGTPPSICFVEG